MWGRLCLNRNITLKFPWSTNIPFSVKNSHTEYSVKLPLSKLHTSLLLWAWKDTLKSVAHYWVFLSDIFLFPSAWSPLPKKKKLLIMTNNSVSPRMQRILCDLFHSGYWKELHTDLRLFTPDGGKGLNNQDINKFNMESTVLLNTTMKEWWHIHRS